MGINRVFLLGNLGADPELRYTTNQNAVCTMRVATGERRKNAEGEWVDHTEWHRVIAWGKTAENCSQYLAKGRQLFVEGRLQTNKWQDKEGKDRYTTEIIAQTVQFVGGKGDSAGLSGGVEMESSPPMGGDDSSFNSSPQQPSGKVPEVKFDDDDIPF